MPLPLPMPLFPVQTTTLEPVEGAPWWVNAILIPVGGLVLGWLVKRYLPEKPPAPDEDDDEDGTPGSPSRTQEWDAARELVAELKTDKAALQRQVDRLTSRLEVAEEILRRLGQDPP